MRTKASKELDKYDPFHVYLERINMRTDRAINHGVFDALVLNAPVSGMGPTLADTFDKTGEVVLKSIIDFVEYGEIELDNGS